MRVIGFTDGDAVLVGRVDGDTVYPLGERTAFWASPAIGSAADGAGSETRPLAGLDLRPALPPTGKVVCIGLNYRKHAEETNSAIPSKPVVFSRWAETLVADGVPSPAWEQAYDWEAELGVVIGRAGTSISEEEALEHVFGYCTFNDLSCRGLQTETAQWTLGKNADRSGPIGAVVSKEEVGDPSQGWRVTAHVNGEQMQDGVTSDFIFSVPQVIAFVSRAMTLRPGDLIITGTPAGVGAGMKPPRFLKPGDVVRVEVEGLGAVTTPIVERN